MCGLFAFIGPGKPDTNRLYDAAQNAIRRGRDAFGIAWVENGRIERRAAIAPFTDQVMPMLREACDRAEGTIIGHARFATHGTKTSRDEVHPFVRGDAAVAHNGVFFDYLRYAREWGITMRTGCDSEVLAARVADLDGVLHERAFGAFDSAGSFACLAMTPTEFTGISRGNPLGFVEVEEGMYICSTGQIGEVDVQKLRDGFIYRTANGPPQFGDVLPVHGSDRRQHTFSAVMEEMESGDPRTERMDVDVDDLEFWFADNIK